MTRKTTWARRKPATEADPRFAPLTDAEATPAAAQPKTSCSTDLSVQPQAKSEQSPAVRAFRREMAKLDRLKAQLAEMQQQGQSYKLQMNQVLQPLLDQRIACMRQMVLALDSWLDVKTKGLSKLQREMALELVCHLSAELAQAGDAEMAALHDRRSPESISDKQQAEAEDMRELFSAMFGSSPPPDLDGNDPDAMMRAAMEKMAAMATEEEERRQAKAAARKAKRKPSAAQQQAEQAQQDADTMLRSIYRQLASALHPDRASDEAERQRKNALMGEANAAYERKDLVTLLNLQLQAELVDPDHLERLSDERLKSLTLLLKRQVADLERERQIEQERWWHDLKLPRGMALTAVALRQNLELERIALEDHLFSMKIDVETASQLTTLKPWLNRQRQMTRAAERRMQMVDDFPF
jgi:hypothetical protein